MRLFFAALFVVIGMMLIVILLSAFFEKASLLVVFLVSICLAVVFLVLVIVAVVLFNWRSVSPYSASYESLILQLERDDLLTTTRFAATRVFQVAEFEDEGSHYFIELVSGDVLYLNGQYLYEYEYERDEMDSAKMADDEIVGGPQTVFPCTDFTIRRHRQEGYVVDIVCEGSRLEAEYIERYSSEVSALRNCPLEDGDIITDKSYDELRALFAS